MSDQSDRNLHPQDNLEAQDARHHLPSPYGYDIPQPIRTMIIDIEEKENSQMWKHVVDMPIEAINTICEIVRGNFEPDIIAITTGQPYGKSSILNGLSLKETNLKFIKSVNWYLNQHIGVTSWVETDTSNPHLTRNRNLDNDQIVPATEIPLKEDPTRDSRNVHYLVVKTKDDMGNSKVARIDFDIEAVTGESLLRHTLIPSKVVPSMSRYARFFDEGKTEF